MYAQIPKYHTLLRDIEARTKESRRRLLQIAQLDSVPSVKLGAQWLVDADVILGYLLQMHLAGTFKHHLW